MEETKELFDQCMKEAQELHYGPFCPELDNLVDQTIASIRMKVIIEKDILTEGHLNISPNNIKAEAWVARADVFLSKWKDYRHKDEIEEGDPL